MSLTDHLHRKNDPIRAFLDERLVDFAPAKEKWHEAQAGKPLVEYADDWTLVGLAIDHRIRMMLTPMHIPVPHEERVRVYGTTLPAVLSELEVIQNRHDGLLGEIPSDEERHLLQVCYVLAMYDAYARGSFSSKRNSPLHTLKPGAKWQAHLNRVSAHDVGVLQTLVEPAIELFPLFVGQRVVTGPVFADSHLVDGADGDLIIGPTLIEIKCESPGFRSNVLRQVIAYALLDATGEYGLTKCSIYLARFGGLAAWDLDEIIREVSQGRYGYVSLREEFHAFLVGQEEERLRKRGALAESKRRFAEQWQAVWDAGTEVGESIFIDDEARQVATIKLVKAIRELHRLEDEAGLGIHRKKGS